MTDDRDPTLEAMFDEAWQALPDDGFTDALFVRIKARHRRMIATRLGILALAIVLEVLLDSPLQNSLGVITKVLGMSIYNFSNEWLAFLLAPVNTVAGILSAVLLGLHFLYRRSSF